MTQAEMMRQVRALGLSVSVREGEIKIGPRGRREDDGYYFTNDRQDAVDTARLMAAGNAKVLNERP